MVAFYHLASIPIQNMSNNNLGIIAKENTGCHGEILVATDMLSRGVNNRYLQTAISYFSKYAENLKLSMQMYRLLSYYVVKW